ncbi:MAG: DUF4294 domain-containing protein [Bacteroidetes bacterium]|nr:DUF4294 domain-containing protein [Bacteroidota bacterium]
MKSIPFILLLVLATMHFSYAQEVYFTDGVIVDNDTIPKIYLREVLIISKRYYKNYDEKAEFNKLVRDVKAAYPYAMDAVVLFKEINEELANMDKRRDKKKYLRTLENEVKDRYKKPVKNLTVTQGKILVKIIEKETKTDCYHLIKELKSPLSAYFWQKTGWLLGYDLKVGYEPDIDPDLDFILRALGNL